MKRTTILLTLAALLLVGCRHEANELTTRTISGEKCYQVLFDNDEAPWGTDFYTKADFKLEWPAKGSVSAEAERELLLLCFMDSAATDFDEAAQRWLATPFSYEEEMDCERKPVKSIDDNEEYGYMHLESSCTQDSACSYAKAARIIGNAGTSARSRCPHGSVHTAARTWTSPSRAAASSPTI